MSAVVKGKHIQIWWVLGDTGYKNHQYLATQYVKLWKLKINLEAMLFRSKPLTFTSLLVVAFNQIINLCCNHSLVHQRQGRGKWGWSMAVGQKAETTRTRDVWSWRCSLGHWVSSRTDGQKSWHKGHEQSSGQSVLQKPNSIDKN